MDDSPTVRRSEIDARLEAVLSAADEQGLPAVRETMEGPTDRWYGRLVAWSYDSLVGDPDPETAYPAAAATELLYGYCRLRSELLVQLTDAKAHSLTRDETATLLAGDYLRTSAHSLLRSVAHPDIADCADAFADVLDSVTDAFVAAYGRPAPSDPDLPPFFEKTVGSVGAGAAAVGATLAGADDARRDAFARVGRGFSTARRIERVLDSDPGTFEVVPPAVDEAELREYANRRRNEAREALEELSAPADVRAPRTLAGGDRRTPDG
ncbi:hypothetical protein [Halopelagius longus]|uniref:Polyprenyl synthetase n=1 Tax=Halopelagius longus TaxID=1236180 RepID=A0A1H0YHI0_9EURY|nr:hypothetical protein [Halopelagius longus]RDI72499.1 polyprenyl synthetase [Halopelagius longus]SDQ14695.1 hypothetical protein SAMN05216278_0643 [Halopelagius longus]